MYKRDCIFEFLILLYKFNKDLRNKIKNKNQEQGNYYLINSDFLKYMKQAFNYKLICKELEKAEYSNDSKFNSKIHDLIKSFKQKININGKDNFSNLEIRPDRRTQYSKTLLINFCLVNNKIFDVIKKIQIMYGLKWEYNKALLKKEFYFRPQLFYKGDGCIRIGELNAYNIFETHYFIDFDLYKSEISSLLNELKNAKDMKDFFKKMNIDINSKEIHELKRFGNQTYGKLINFRFSRQNRTEYNNFNFNNLVDSYTIVKVQKEISHKEDLSNLDNFQIKSFAELPFTPMIGLQNIGQTCYMNAALQCFSNTKALTKYFLNYNKLDYLKNNSIIMFGSEEPSLVIEYLKLLRHLWCDEPKSNYAPREFKEQIGKINPLFKNFEANDAKDFVNFMIMRLHDELNLVDNSLTKYQNYKEPIMPINQYDQNQILQAYLYDFQMNFQSFISNCFYGTVQGEFECQNCKMRMLQMGQNMPLIKYNYQTYFFLNFPLDEVRKYVLSNQMLYMKYMNQGVNPNLSIHLLDCFYYYQKDDLLTCYCERCQRDDSQVITRSKLFTAPIYLILLLNRGNGIEFNIKLIFPEEFDTTGIFINSNGIYQLYGVVKHFGDNNSSGHFTAYCRSPIDDLWYFYNDAVVTPVNEQEKYRIQEVGLTYMLFYRQKNT